MSKILTIALRDVYVIFTNRSLLLIMILTPLVLALIMGFAFGSGGGEISIPKIDLVVVNLDEGVGNQHYGDIVTSILQAQPAAPGDGDLSCSLASGDSAAPSATSLDDILNTTLLDDPAAARAAVDNETYAAALIIPQDFTAALISPQAGAAPQSLRDLFGFVLDGNSIASTQQVTVEIYADGNRPISAGVARSIAEAVISRIVGGNIAIRASIDVMVQSPQNLPILIAATDESFSDFSCAFTGDLNTVQLVRLPLDDIQVQPAFVQILVAIGSGQAMFFSIFAANGTLQMLYTERRNWTLQRMLITPTPRVYILAGKVLGALLVVLVQVGLLLLALTVLASLVLGTPMFIWGSNPLLVVVTVLAVGVAVSGLAIFVTGIARSPEQAQILGSLASMTMGVLGGIFGFSVGAPLQYASIIHWGTTAFSKLSGGDTSIGLNLLMLLGIGGVLFTVGAWFFNRRIEV